VALVHKLLNLPACTRGSIAHRMVTFAQFTDHIGLPEIQELERHYGVNQ